MNWANSERYMLHIEPTNMCNAACPICPRYHVSTRRVRYDLVPTHITIEQYKKWFSPEFLANKVGRVMLCGNQGDPFATKDIIEIIKYTLKHIPKDCSFITHSNGGLRKTDVWKQAGELIQGSHKWFTFFSIDGLEDTNHLYRRNVNWQKLMENVRAYIDAGGNAYWDMLVFKHNEHQINQVEQLSKEMGFIKTRIKSPDGFYYNNAIQKRGVYDYDGHIEYTIEASSLPKFTNAPIDAVRNLKAPPQQMPMNPKQEISDSENYLRYETHNITCKSLKRSNTLGSEIMIQCDGTVYPCCFIGELFSSQRTDLGKKQLQDMWDMKKMNLHENSLPSILEYFDNILIPSWNKQNYTQGKNMFCSKICGLDSQIDRIGI